MIAPFPTDPALGGVLRVVGSSTMILAVGLLAARAWASFPARAHRALFLATLGVLLLPGVSALVRAGNLGLVPPPGTPAREPEPTTPDRSLTDARPVRAIASQSTPLTANRLPRDASGAKPTLFAERQEEVIRLGLAASLVAWSATSVGLLLRLAGAFRDGVRFRARAREAADPDLADLVAEVARLARVRVAFEVRVHPEAPCPMVWGWGRRATLILPARLDEPGGRAATAGGAEGLAAVLGHELAHAERRDHVAALLGELVVAALPWQPLAWLARGRLATLAERAADDWALARLGPGRAADYAEALLDWAVDRRRPLLLAAVARPSGLAARVRHILKGAPPMPETGRRWSWIASTLAAGLVALLALAQTRTAPVQAAPNPRPEAPMPDAPTKLTTLTGVVIDPLGRPIAGAEVLIIARDEPTSRLSQALGPAEGGPSLRVAARGPTDGAGRYKLDAAIPSFRPGDAVWAEVLAYRPGSAPASAVAVPGRPEARIILAPAVPIRGRLLRPDGTPASGARVRLDDYGDLDGRDEVAGRACEFGRANWPGRPGFFPGEVVADADGRFVLDGFVPAETFARLRVEAPGLAAEDLVVSTQATVRATPILVAFEQQPLPRDFTQTLRPARVVLGTITDDATARPIAGLAVMVTPMGRHGGMPVRAVTDAEGHYRVADKEGETYWVAAIPDAGSGLVGEVRGMLRMPEGRAELAVDMALRRGVVIRGRVVDDATGGPIAGAGVVYRPDDKNPRARRTDLFGHHPPVAARTDADGRFAVTGLPGAGMLGVDADDDSFIRRAVGEGDALPQGFARLDIPEGGGPPEVVVPLRRGVALEAAVARPDGSAPEYVQAWCPELSARLLGNQFNPVPFVGGRFRLDGAEPGRTYRVLLLDANRQLGAAVDLRAVANPAGPPVAVRLAPTASLRGRVVDARGNPPKSTQVLAHIDYLGRGDRLTRADLYDDMALPLQVNLTQEVGVPEARPDFRLDGLIPGVGYVLTWSSDAGIPDQSYHLVGPLAPGEVRDLGDVRPRPSPPGP